MKYFNKVIFLIFVLGVSACDNTESNWDEIKWDEDKWSYHFISKMSETKYS